MLESHYDLVVIGGGIQGAGVAQAAVAAGYSVLLLERGRWGAGTSSRSSKLIHGGLRYLESGQLGLVRKALAERATLLRIAPHLVRPIPFLIPVYRHSHRAAWQVRLGLRLYRLLAGRDPLAEFGALSAEECRALPGLTQAELLAVFRYWDAQADDRLLTRAVVASVRALGGQALEEAEFLQAQRRSDHWQVHFRQPNGERRVSASVVVNAAGPWINQVMARILPDPGHFPLALVQGSHLLLDRALGEAVYYLEARDRRGVFTIPWNGGSLLGTTELAYTGDPDRCATTPEEERYLLETLARYFPDSGVQVTGRIAGLRVLPDAAGGFFHRPRDTRVLERWTGACGLLALYGGKLTTYRATAEALVARIDGRLGARDRRSDTATLMLPDPI